MKKKVEPSPGVDCAHVRPPERSTMRLQVANPIPLPLMSFPWRRLNGSKMADAFSGLKPCPLWGGEL